MRRRQPSLYRNVRLVLALIVIAIGIFYRLFPEYKPPAVQTIQPVQPVQTQISGDLTVSRVIDGDTVVLSDGEKLRLIGVDTPESSGNPKLIRDVKKSGQSKEFLKKLGKIAKSKTEAIVQGKKVRIETDVQSRDRYGRLLGYLYLQDDGTFVNAQMLKEGYAQVMSIPPNVKYQDLFLELQQEARKDRRGFWA